MLPVFMSITGFGTLFSELSSFEEEDYESGCHGDEYILNSTTNGNISLSQGPPLLIQPTDRKVFHVAEGQRIQFVISIASSPTPKQRLTVSKANMEQKRSIGVEFYSTERSTLKAVVVPLEMPLYSADVVGSVVMYRTRHKQKFLQETVKELEEAEKKGSMDSLDIWRREDGNKEFDNSTQEDDPYLRLQSLNTFNNPEEPI
uniref:Uncharacterized protein n=1 Tax=Magallana gigas TaxID=29159 RepID=A0A8W8MNT8_MAGGI